MTSSRISLKKGGSSPFSTALKKYFLYPNNDFDLCDYSGIKNN